jgi:hypothetical protein
MAERLDTLEAVAHELIELIYDPKDKTAAARQEKRTQAKAKLLAVLDAIIAQAHACEAYCSIFAEVPQDALPPSLAAEEDTAAV